MSSQKCLECGTLMKTTRENYKYDASGLPGIVLLDVETTKCPECGEREVHIPNIEGLHRALALTIVRKKERLTPDEIRFLRKYLGLSSVDFAEHIGVSAETVSRWEQGRTTMGQTADRFLRWLAVTREPISHYPLEILKEVAQTDAKPLRARFRIGEGGWHAARELVHA
jgi:putative zinc finger/helix-turn-helix YgiT family protein